MIPASELSQLRSEAERLLTESCVVRSPGTPVSDGAGGTTPGTPSDSASTACSRHIPTARGSSGELQLANQLQLVNPWLIQLPVGTSVDGEDQIVIGSDVYEVRAVLEGDTRAILQRVLCVAELA